MNTPYSESNKTEYAGLSIKKTLIVIGSMLVVGVILISIIFAFKPEAQKKPQKPKVVTVETIEFATRQYSIKLFSNGNIKAKTQSALIAQVSGEITSIEENFSAGGVFKQGDILLTIDQRNYAAAVSSTKASLSQAQASYEAEQANAAQAKKDWERLGFEGEPNNRVLRKPQLAAAKAQRDAARAALNMAQLDYDKTRIRAPYDGNVIKRNVGLGEFVNVGKQLGEIFSNQGLEVSLPLNQQQYAQLDFSSTIPVTLYTELAGVTHKWPASLVRTAQAFDTTTRQIDAIAKVDNNLSDRNLKLKIGQFVKAEINARTIDNATVIPNSAVREGAYIFLYQDGILNRQPINIIWQDDTHTIIEPLETDALVVTTSLSGVVSGTKARLLSEATSNKNNKPEDTAKTVDKQSTENQKSTSQLKR